MYRCLEPTCDKKYKQYGNLVRHRLDVHPKNDVIVSRHTRSIKTERQREQKQRRKKEQHAVDLQLVIDSNLRVRR